MLLTIEYDGTDFSGWQKQANMRTVQGELEKALTYVCRTPIKVNGTSRTDAGVHAIGQRVSFSADFGLPIDKIVLTTNNHLQAVLKGLGPGPDLRIVDAIEKPLNFHARYNSSGKKYKYIIKNTEDFDIFNRNYCYWIKEKLNIHLMKAAAELIIGTHDFKCFQAAGGKEKLSTIRAVYSLNITKDSKNEDYITIEIVGDGFLYNMVRIIVGTLVEVGLGKMQVNEISDIIDGKDRTKSGHTAPPQGLYLVEVYYDKIDERYGNVGNGI